MAKHKPRKPKVQPRRTRLSIGKLDGGGIQYEFDCPHATSMIISFGPPAFVLDETIAMLAAKHETTCRCANDIKLGEAERAAIARNVSPV